MATPYLCGAYIVEERVQSWSEYPFSLPFVRDLDWSIRSMVSNRPAEAVWTSRFVVTQRAAAHGPGRSSSSCFAG